MGMRDKQIRNRSQIRMTEIIQAAFLLSDTKKLADKVFKGGKGYYVIQFKARKAPDVAELDDQKETLKKQLITQKQETLFNQWIGENINFSIVYSNDKVLSLDLTLCVISVHQKDYDIQNFKYLSRNCKCIM